MLKFPLIVAAALCLSFSASAVTLQNKDSSSYDIKVRGSSSTMSTSISGGTVKNNICNSCKIEVKGVGEVEASGSDKVVIKDGKLTKN